ncbi:MAG: hypothetical protein PF637_04710 [Spirochaetes bacterium]|jgi:hypothetical protein|nr:hypothetical protein [Spirochaetota bacterium]
MYKSAIMLIISTFLCFQMSASSTGTEVKAIVDHLSYLGYTADVQKTSITVRHPSKPGFDIIPAQGGILLRSWFQHKKDALPVQDKFMKLVNLMNLNSLVTRYSIDPRSDLILQAFYPLPYSKGAFAAFITAWEADFIKNSSTYAKELSSFIE